MTPEDFRLLYDFNAWANGRILDACDGLSPDEFTRDLKSSFPSIRDTLAHIAGAEWVWAQRWRGTSPTAPAEWVKTADRAGLRERLTALDRDLLEFASRLSAADLVRDLEYRQLAGQPYAQPLWQPMQHLANHGTYHRGQIVTMLRQLGAQPPHTDLVVFYREKGKTGA